MADDLVSILSSELPGVVRWAGAVARQLRRHDIAIGGKASGYAATDALTLADLSIQELLVAALRDMGPRMRACRMEAEETSGDLGRFAADGEWVLAMDPIDGTREYRDRTGNGYSVMVHLRSAADVVYSLVYLPEVGPHGTWVETRADGVAVGADDHDREARVVLDRLPRYRTRPARHQRILVEGFLRHERERAASVTAAGLQGLLDPELEGSLFPLLASGEIAGALCHTPNVYDFPVAIQIARALGGDAVWTHDRRRVDFRTIWRDERSGMLRLPGIIACAVDREVLTTLASVARDWSGERYDASDP